MRVLVVEDSKILQRTIGTALKRSGYAVDVTGDGVEGLWYAESNPYDVIILDLMIPGLDGLSLLKKIRSRGNQVHTLILTAKDAVEDRVRGLRAGSDDYLVKPFAIDELLARVQALCRRGYGSKSTTITVGDLLIDTLNKNASVRDREITLTAREFRVLEYLALRKGQVVSRHEIEAHIYDETADPLSNVVDAVVCLLRKKLATPDGDDLIQTRRGLGYVIDARQS
jgi:DNA-binding response OmpR family regulator